MGLQKESIESLRSKNPNHSWILKKTEHVFSNQVNWEELPKIIDPMFSNDGILGSGRTCVIMGYGSQPKALYRYLHTVSSVEVLWDAPYMPMWMYPLSLIAAAHGGLVQVGDKERLTEVFTMLANHAMLELFSFSEPLLPILRAHVKKKRWRSRIGSIIGEDPTYFSLGADGDYSGEKELMMWCTYGDKSPVTYQSSIK